VRAFVRSFVRSFARSLARSLVRWFVQQVFDEATHSYVGQFGTRGEGPGQLQNPNNIAVDDAVVYVTDGSNHRVCVSPRRRH
jgi:hypothetical protein